MTSGSLARSEKGPGEKATERRESTARSDVKAYSQEDQAILEAAYQSDPKPDKAARLELVNQVALGEKEVQVSRLSSPMLLNFASRLLTLAADMVSEPTPKLQAEVKASAPARSRPISNVASRHSC